jgi:hypothetical protein
MVKLLEQPFQDSIFLRAGLHFGGRDGQEAELISDMSATLSEGHAIQVLESIQLACQKVMGSIPKAAAWRGRTEPIRMNLPIIPFSRDYGSAVGYDPSSYKGWNSGVIANQCVCLPSRAKEQ